VFSMCDGDATIAELASDIGEVFGMPSDDVERQVRSLLRQLRRQQLLEAAAPTDEAARPRKSKVASRG
ncbi:MAG: PqqD family peptide modification chaperone, partial [Nocardioidaceae bacterium]